MAASVRFSLSSDDESKQTRQKQVENQNVLDSPPKTVFKPFPKIIIQSIEAERQLRHLPVSQSSSEFLPIRRSSSDTNDSDDEDRNEPKQVKSTNTVLNEHSNLPASSSNTKKSPSQVRLTQNSNYDIITNDKSQLSKVANKKLVTSPKVSSPDRKPKQNSTSSTPRTIIQRRLGRRLHMSRSSSGIVRFSGQRRSMPNFSMRNRRHVSLPRNSKWHIVRRRLHEIAMMNESYARMKNLEQDIRWTNLREKISAQVLDMREINLLRQQDSGLLNKKKSQKTKFNLRAIPINEIIYIEREGRLCSMTTRDLVLGRLLCDEQVELDTFAQLDARRQFQVQQHLIKQQEGRTRLKKHIAFSFCLCNLSCIVIMFAAMLIFASKTILELSSY